MSFLIENDITGIEAIDTRALTKILRDKGTMKGMITTDENFDKDDCIKRIKAWSMGHVVLDVTCKEKMSFPGDGYKVAVIDLGVKKNIVRCLLERGCISGGDSCRGDHRGCTGRHYADEWSWRSEGQCEDN